MSLKVARAVQLLLVIGMFGLATDIVGQSNKPGSWFQPNPNLNAQEKKGEYLFLQRCSLCHMMKYGRSGPKLPAVWLNLEGLFKDAGPDQEKTVRELILKGTPRMPAWQYTLDAKQIDDVIAYLKTL